MSSPEATKPIPDQAGPKKSPWQRIVLESLTALCIGVILAFLWPKIVGEELSTRGHARLYAPFAGELYGAAKRDQTSVLLIDNAALNDAGEAWPPHYSYHARLLKALARYHPRAVFLDIYFAEVRDDPTLAALTNNLCALREQGTQVFLGVSPDATGSAKLRPELESLEGKCFEKVALQYNPDRLDRQAWTYPLENEDEKNKHGEVLPSAALAIYRQALGHQLEVKDNELALTWGLPPAAYGVRWLEAAGKKHKKEGAGRLYCRQDFGVLELAPAFIKNRQHNDAEKPVCVFHETLYASDLVTNSEQEEAVLKQLLTGKVVMVGTALSGGGDRVLSRCTDGFRACICMRWRWIICCASATVIARSADGTESGLESFQTLCIPPAEFVFRSGVAQGSSGTLERVRAGPMASPCRSFYFRLRRPFKPFIRWLAEPKAKPELKSPDSKPASAARKPSKKNIAYLP